MKSTGWGGRDRTSEWRNQNPLISSTKSATVLKFHGLSDPKNHNKINGCQNDGDVK